MSNKSIGSKIQGLEEKLRAENESRNRDEPSLNNAGGTGPPRPAGPRRPRPSPMNTAMSNRTRPMHMDIPAFPAVSQDSIETENRLQEIKMSGNLTIDGKKFPPDIRDLEQLGELGNGTCGHVVKMLHKPSEAVIAVKQMRRSGNSEENKRILMDLDVVRRSHGCPYIVRCLGCFITEADVWICMELMASCFDKILKRLGGPVPEDILGKVTVATVKALSYLKDVHGVMHRDVKPSNILVDVHGSIKLCDFGISGRLVDSKAKTRSAGCAAYMAPERIDPPDPQKPDYDIRADVWSLGISLVELATGIFPYRDCQNDFEVLSKVIGEEPPVLPENQAFSTEFKSFVGQCLTKNYHNRPKYGRLLQHAFLQKAECSGVRVDSWLATVLPPPQRLETPPVTRRITHPEDSSPLSHHPPHTIKPPAMFNGSSHQPPALSSPLHPPTSNGLSLPIGSNHPVGLNLPIGPNLPVSPSRSVGLSLPIGANLPINPVDNEAKNFFKSNESPKLSPESEHSSSFRDSKKSSQESPDQSLSESSKASCISTSARDQNLVLRDSSLVNRISSPIDDCESSSFSSMTVEGDSVRDVAMVSIENLNFVQPKQIQDIENTRIQSPPLEKTVLRIQRNATPEYYTTNGSSANGPVRGQNYNYSNAPVSDNSPNEYNLQHRVRSLSNTMVYGNNGGERHPPPRFVTGSPNSKNYFANLEIRNQPFSGGGPSSFDSYTNQSHGHRSHDSGDYQSGSYHGQGSPDMARRQAFFSPSRSNKPPPPMPQNYEYVNHPRDTHANVVSPPNFMLGRDGYDNLPGDGCNRENQQQHRFSPNFRTDAPTNYFTSTSVCTMSRFGPVPVQQRMAPMGGGYHQNPGGSCSQPASLEAYGETRHYPAYVHARPPEKSYNPALRSPQPVARRSAVANRERDERDRERWRTGDSQHHHTQVQGNTSPIVLQRFYHQQSQRRSRRDLRDGSPRQRTSVSREASVGRSPEPPRRAHRDPSNGRTDGSPHRDQQSLRERLERERIPTESHLPERDSRQTFMDRDRQPDLIRPHQRYERDARHSQDPRENDNPNRERFDPRTNQNPRRERREDQNGTEKDDQSDNLCSPRERFENRMQERKNNKEVYHHSRERERRDDQVTPSNGDVHRSKEDDSVRLSPQVLRKHGKSHKDKDDQGWLNSIAGIVKRRFTSYVKLHLGGSGSHLERSSGGPGGSGTSASQRDHSGGGHSRGSRFGGIPRRVADCDDGQDGKRDAHYASGLRYGVPQPPPRRATESWSLPASPLPSRPS